MQSARASTRVAVIAGDQVLVVGNDNICTPGGVSEASTITEVGDPAQGTWTLAGPLPRPREDFVLAPLPDGSALVIGGLTDWLEGDAVQSFSSTFRFDPQARVWHRSGDLSTARLAPLAAVLHDGRVLVAGGWFIDGIAGISPRALRTAEIFDPASETWHPTGSLITSRGGLVASGYGYEGDDGFAATLSDGRVLVAGGEADFSAEIYDPASGEWSIAGKLGFDISALVPLPGGDALAVGGKLFDFGPSTSTGRASRFDAQSQTWQETGPMLGRYTNRSVLALADGRVLVAGGQLEEVISGEPAFVADAELYDPAADRWQQAAALPRPRGGAAGARIADGSVLLVGGMRGEWDVGAPSCPGVADSAVRYTPDE